MIETTREHQSPEAALQDALKELRDFGMNDPSLEEKARELEVGQRLSGDLPDGGTWTLERQAAQSYLVKTDKE